MHRAKANPDTIGFSSMVLQLLPRALEMRTDTIGFSRWYFNFSLAHRENTTDTIGFSRMVLQLLPNER